jgi:hypothetical protein
MLVSPVPLDMSSSLCFSSNKELKYKAWTNFYCFSTTLSNYGLCRFCTFYLGVNASWKNAFLEVYCRSCYLKQGLFILKSQNEAMIRLKQGSSAARNTYCLSTTLTNYSLCMFCTFCLGITDSWKNAQISAANNTLSIFTIFWYYFLWMFYTFYLGVNTSWKNASLDV